MFKEFETLQFLEEACIQLQIWDDSDDTAEVPALPRARRAMESLRDYLLEQLKQLPESDLRAKLKEYNERVGSASAPAWDERIFGQAPYTIR